MTYILDSTLRDGAYLFGNAMPIAYVNTIATNLDTLVDYIEVGSPVSFGCGSINALEDDIYRLSSLKGILSNAKSAVFIQPSLWKYIGSPSIAETFAGTADLIRFGLDPELDLTIEEDLLSQCFQASIPCSINLMKAYRYTEQQLMALSPLLNSNVQYISIVDSSGCMSPQEVCKLAAFISRRFKALIGLHIHNNTGYANHISLQGLGTGYCVDSTLLGKGRAGGNADTCLLVLKRALMAGASLDVVDGYLRKLMSATSLIWGAEARTHLIDILLGITSLHSSSLSSDSFGKLDLIPSINSMLDVAWKR